MEEVHFTYSDEVCADSLKQGDILEKTEELVALMHEIHPHYANEYYTHFQVLTQSCDLVQRGGRPCSARYITLAAIRPLKDILSRNLEQYSGGLINLEGVTYCTDRYKRALKDFVTKIFNNNHKELFFLQSFPSRGLLVDSCTMLHLSIAIKSEVHYDLCLRSKRIELDDNFKSKLGWLVGNLYSRVGTTDYALGTDMSGEGFVDLIDGTLKDHIAWVPDKSFSKFKRGTTRFSTYEEVMGYIQEESSTKEERVLDQIANQVAKAANLDSEVVGKVKNALAANTTIRKAIKS